MASTVDPSGGPALRLGIGQSGSVVDCDRASGLVSSLVISTLVTDSAAWAAGRAVYLPASADCSRVAPGRRRKFSSGQGAGDCRGGHVAGRELHEQIEPVDQGLHGCALDLRESA